MSHGLRSRCACAVLALFALATGFASSVRAEDWLRFRGPNGTGQATSAAPTEWDAEKHVLWSVPLPGPGNSSPVVVGDRVFVTCWTGYATKGQGKAKQAEGGPGEGGNGDADLSALKLHLVCVDRTTGEIRWDRSVPARQPENVYEGNFADNGYATHSAASDGERVFAFFGKTGVYAYDLDGEPLWNATVGDKLRGAGSASSPILFEDLLIVPAFAESQSLVAFSAATGEEVWRTKVEGSGGAYGTPALAKVDDSRTDLVVLASPGVRGYDPRTGEERWFATTPTHASSSVLVDGDVVYGVENSDGGAAAVRAGGMGDVTETHVLWTGDPRGRFISPVLVDGRLYTFPSFIATTLDAKTGEVLSEDRLEKPPGVREGGAQYSSPVVAGGNVYWTSRSGTVYVVAAGEEFEQVAANRFTRNESEWFVASPAIVDGQIFLRSSERLYCIAAENAKVATTER
ncbi:MAG TPA: PQQ-binding-like beta-propeller repeat protein [Pirellulaceae bacterium]|jgi:hypothetical protein|nr:PQQ-binding-like beta-propeller repeat protein [Pirellulaceae bacterium]